MRAHADVEAAVEEKTPRRPYRLIAYMTCDKHKT
jgi:hypothetical protein